MNVEVKLRAADVVRHRPTGDKWVVAYADMERGEVSACGSPAVIADVADCDLVEAATDEQYEQMLRRWADMPAHVAGNDHRPGVCRRQLAALEQGRVTSTSLAELQSTVTSIMGGKP